MNKSLYSLILSDGVIREIDRLAYKSGTNRSGMINQILAEYVSYTTPEMRISQIFSSLENLLSGGDDFKLLINNSASVMNLRSSLDYKYNPSVRYAVELYKTDNENIGEMKVSLRTQSAALISYMMEFYKAFASLESARVKNVEYYLEGDRFVRKLKLRKEGVDAEALGSIIADYIKMFDSCLKAFFYNIDSIQRASYEVDRILCEYLETRGAII